MDKQATFTEMLNGTAEDYAIIGEHGAKFASELPDRILEHLSILKGDTGGFAVDRFTHCLQTATRAYRDGRDEEYVVCALLHDIGDTIASANHADLAATMLEPFVSEENYWIVKHHGIFQGYYFFEYLGLDKNMRDEYKDSPANPHYWYRYNDKVSEWESISAEEHGPPQWLKIPFRLRRNMLTTGR